jgi:hypothetical protein
MVKQQITPFARPQRWSLDAKSAKRSSARTWSKHLGLHCSLNTLEKKPPQLGLGTNKTDPQIILIGILKKKTSTAHTATTSSLWRQRLHRWVLLLKDRTREWATGKKMICCSYSFDHPWKQDADKH